MGAMFAFPQSPAESKKAPSKIIRLSIFIENSGKYLLKSITWIPIYKSLIIMAILRVTLYDTTYIND